MRPLDVILSKRNGERHDREVLREFIGAYVAGSVPDYQVAAWLMAVYFNGMDGAETADLTSVMAESGDMLDLSSLPYTVDKHSTGGVGDKTTLVLAPLLAQAGATVAKMSGRGLGHTGGTVDKLESIPGFRSALSDDEFLWQAREVRVVVSGQSKEMAPADGLLYSLRDATGTIDSLPLIASSIMSKKLAGGASAIVLDVKVGSGAFMRTVEDARRLARAMVEIGRHAGRQVRAVLSSMEQPLGRAIGNALEVREAISCLKGEGPADLEELCLTLGAEVLEAAGLSRGREDLALMLRDGSAFSRFASWIDAQGGDTSRLEALEVSGETVHVRASRGGTVRQIDALSLGRAVGLLGGGRSKKGDEIDHGVGALLHRKVGDQVEADEPVATLYHRGGRGLDDALAAVRGAVRVGEDLESPPLLLELIAD